MKRVAVILFCIAVRAAAATAVRGKGEIDWARRLAVGRGVAGPDLNAPSIAAARLGAARAAKAQAWQGAIDAIAALPAASGGTVAALLEADATLRARLTEEVKGGILKDQRYYSDGGMALSVEVALDSLPAPIARAVQVPKGAVPLRGAEAAPVESERGPYPPGRDDR
jgi:hypothetical protein